MAIKICGDRVEIGNFCFCQSSDGVYFTGAGLVSNTVPSIPPGTPAVISPLQGTVAGYTFGGGSNTRSCAARINKFSFASDTCVAGNACLPFCCQRLTAGHFSETKGYASGGDGQPPTAQIDRIESFPFASMVNSQGIGACLACCTEQAAGHSSETDAYSSDGKLGRPTFQIAGLIQKFNFASENNATCIGCTVCRKEVSTGTMSDNHGYTIGGNRSPFDAPFPEPYPGAAVCNYDKFPFASDTNASLVGDFDGNHRFGGTGSHSPTTGFLTGGTKQNFSGSSATSDILSFPFASDTPMTDTGFGITRAFGNNLGQASSVAHGYVVGGTPFQGCDRIDKFNFASVTTGSNVGNLGNCDSGQTGSAQD